jgi:hypothetical protein
VLLHPTFDNVLDLLPLEIDLGDQLADGLVVDLEVADRGVGGGPLLLAAGPGDLLDPAVRLTAVVGGVGVLAPGRLGVAGVLVFWELDPSALVFDRRQCGV